MGSPSRYKRLSIPLILILFPSILFAWLSGYNYRASIFIQENSGGDLTDYQVRLVLDNSNFDFSKVQNDGDDIRFTDTLDQELWYWYETWNYGTQAVVWVKIPSIQANDTFKIYLYYGNPSVTSKSNMDSTMDFVEVNSITTSNTFNTGDNGNNPSTWTWDRVDLQKSFSNPVVVAQFVYYQGGNSAIIRIDNATSDSFKIRVIEPSTRDNLHLPELIGTMVLNEGTYQFPDGTRIEANKYSTTSTVGMNVSNQWDTKTFSLGFNPDPIVLAQPMTSNDISQQARFVKIRERDLRDSDGSFELALEEEYDNTSQRSTAETVAWIAIERDGISTPKTGTLPQMTNDPSPVPYEVGISYDNVRGIYNGWKTVSFTQSFSSTPTLILGYGSYDGGHNSELRYKSLTSTGFQVAVEEDYTHGNNDYEGQTRHTTEDVFWFTTGETGVFPIAKRVDPQPTVTLRYEITGRVFEDTDGEGDRFESSDEGKSDVLVRLYQDNGDGILGTGDSFVDSTRTDADGYYTIYVSSPDTYFVVVNSRDITPKGGLNAGYSQTDIWAEGVSVGEFISGVYSFHREFGGEDPARSDSFSLSTIVDDNVYEHIARVDVEGSVDSSIDFGFSFNTIVNTRDGDDMTGEGRSIQGSFRQFIQNSNAIQGKNISRFVMAVPTNSSGGGGNWWTITLTSTLPTISDDSTQIDGTVYDTSDGVTQRDDNPGAVGTGGTVGIGTDGIPATGDEPTLNQFNKPEIEIYGNSVNGHIIYANNADYIVVKNMALYGNGGSWTSMIRIDNSTGDTIRDNLAGIRADGTVEAKPGTNGRFVFYRNTTNSIIIHNYVADSDRDAYGIQVYNGSGTIVEENEIGGGGTGGFLYGIIMYQNNSTCRENLIYSTGGGFGIGTFYGPYSNIIYENNTVYSTIGYAPIAAGYGSSDITIRYNLVYNNSNGIRVYNSSGVYSPAQGIRITKNSVYNNGGVGIDLRVNTGVTPNNGTKSSALPNYDMDYPVFTEVTLKGSNILHIEGYVGSQPGQSTFGNSTIEIYKAFDDGDNNGEIVEGDLLSVSHGEGRYYIGACVTDANGNFDCDITIPDAVSLTLGDSITATAVDNNDNTSEFSANYLVTSKIYGYVYKDANHNMVMDAEELGISGVRIELWDGASISDSVITDSTGYYEFTADTGSWRVIEDYNDTYVSDNTQGADSTEYISTTSNVVDITLSIPWKKLNFGDFHGSKIEGVVFKDAVCDSSTTDNNDGELDTGEAGIEGVLVEVKDGSSVYDRDYTDGNGNYTIWIDYTAGSPLTLIEYNKTGWLSTGDYEGMYSSGNNADTVSISFSSGVVYSDYNFGDVEEIYISSEKRVIGTPGIGVTLSHILYIKTEGRVYISTTSLQGFNWSIYHDVDTNGQYSPGDTLLPESFDVLPCERYSIILKTFVPGDIPLGTVERLTVTVVESLANNSYLVDSTEVIDEVVISSGILSLTNEVDKYQALPGDTLAYTLSFKNMGTDTIENIELWSSLDGNVSFLFNFYAPSKNVEFQYPSGIIDTLNAEDGELTGNIDTDGDGALLFYDGSNYILRVIFDDLDPALSYLLGGEGGYIKFRVKIE